MNILSGIFEALCPPVRLPEIPFQPAKTIDLTARRWGRNFNILRHEDGGRRLSIAMWLSEEPEEGDYLILPNDRNDTTRYRIEKLECCYNPRDMWFAELAFAPRAAADKDRP